MKIINIIAALVACVLASSCGRDMTGVNLIPDCDCTTYRWGFIDSTGNVVIPYEYTDAMPFIGEVARVKKVDHWGLINKNGKFVQKAELSGIELVGGGYYAVSKFIPGKSLMYSLVDPDGKNITPFDYKSIDKFKDGLSMVIMESDGIEHNGYIDTLGNVVIDSPYVYNSSFSEGVAAVGKSADYEQLWGYMDTTGRLVIPMEFSNCHDFSEGYAAAKNGTLWGFIDKSGQVKIPFKYIDAKSFSEGLAAVQDGIWWGYIDKEGKEITPCRYAKAGYFRNDRAVVTNSGMQGLIDRTGRVVIPVKYDHVKPLNDGYYSVGIWGRGVGIYDKDGNEIIPCSYENVGYIEDCGLIPVRDNKRWGYVDMHNNIVIPIKYHAAGSFIDGLAYVGNGYVDESGNSYKSRREYILSRK